MAKYIRCGGKWGTVVDLGGGVVADVHGRVST